LGTEALKTLPVRTAQPWTLSVLDLEEIARPAGEPQLQDTIAQGEFFRLPGIARQSPDGF
jgi:hypothetical protein